MIYEEEVVKGLTNCIYELREKVFEFAISLRLGAYERVTTATEQDLSTDVPR